MYFNVLISGLWMNVASMLYLIAWLNVLHLEKYTIFMPLIREHFMYRFHDNQLISNPAVWAHISSFPHRNLHQGEGGSRFLFMISLYFVFFLHLNFFLIKFNIGYTANYFDCQRVRELCRLNVNLSNNHVNIAWFHIDLLNRRIFLTPSPSFC